MNSDEELNTLEHQANVGIAAGWVGINPHKVLGMVASLRRLLVVEKELREALEKYQAWFECFGEHTARCEINFSMRPIIERRCDCGFSEAEAESIALRAALAREMEVKNG